MIKIFIKLSLYSTYIRLWLESSLSGKGIENGENFETALPNLDNRFYDLSVINGRCNNTFIF